VPLYPWWFSYPHYKIFFWKVWEPPTPTQNLDRVWESRGYENRETLRYFFMFLFFKKWESLSLNQRRREMFDEKFLFSPRANSVNFDCMFYHSFPAFSLSQYLNVFFQSPPRNTCALWVQLLNQSSRCTSDRNPIIFPKMRKKLWLMGSPGIIEWLVWHQKIELVSLRVMMLC